MAFAYGQTRVAPTTTGDREVVYGWYTNAASDTGGTVNTGLKIVDNFEINSGSASIQFRINPTAPGSTYPVAGNSIRVTTKAGDYGIWKAEGL